MTENNNTENKTTTSLEQMTHTQANAQFVKEIGSLVKDVAWGPGITVLGIYGACNTPEFGTEPASQIAHYMLKILMGITAGIGIGNFAGGLMGIRDRAEKYVNDKQEYVRVNYNRQLVD